MFCPNCGQQQASESTRFCSRCGFKLNDVQEAPFKRLAAIALYLALATCAILGWGSFTLSPAYMQVRTIITVLAAITFYLLFANDLKGLIHKLLPENIERAKQVISQTRESALPPAGIPVHDLKAPRVNTAELLHPPSVTERTTSLLDRDGPSIE